MEDDNQSTEPAAPAAPAATGGAEPKQKIVALLLAIFAGTLGVHRFYTGHMGTGIVMLLTLGGCGLWALYDIIMIATGSFKDVDGNDLA